MTARCDREHFIPLRKGELIDALCADPELPLAVREPFRQFCRLVTGIYHFEFHQLLEKLKTAYAPFDPDGDTKPLVRLSADQKQQQLNALYSEFGELMERANFRHLDRDDIGPALRGSSHSGLRIDVDFRVFERLAIFARGETVQKRKRRRFRRGWRQEEVEVPTYQRLVMILKLRPHSRLGRQVDTESVYFQLFKNIPKRELSTLLPGARARITAFDRGKISFSLLSGLALTAWRILQQIPETIAGVFLLDHPAALWGLISGTVGYGAKTYFGYQQTKQHYNLKLTQVLYFQNLDTNAGVLYRVLDEAEEQQWREVVLGYYCLWRQAGEQGWTSCELEEHVEMDLKRRANLQVDFSTRAALAHLEKLNLLDRMGDRYRAQPLAKALLLLDWTWDNYFKHCKLKLELPPVPVSPSLNP
ncbi:MAG TPA: DUF3754 domain-containing protein [Gemmataceae bacterium]|jgi:hypothetical protein|nr:DUF3754 domain-containing protein [Gemmataceae bacterium]